jgi:hypothetical protein
LDPRTLNSDLNCGDPTTLTAHTDTSSLDSRWAVRAAVTIAMLAERFLESEKSTTDYTDFTDG